MVFGLLLTAIFSASTVPQEPISPRTVAVERRIEQPATTIALASKEKGVAKTSPADNTTLAVGCTWDTCTGKTPQSMGCNADRQVLYQSVPGDLLGIFLYYSPSCRAAWSEFFGNCSGTGASCGLQIWYTGQFGFVEQVFFLRIGSGTGSATPMVSWNNSVKACSTTRPTNTPVDPSPDGGRNDADYECTQWY
ncbi:DUF2690 domain-containing protein [Actinocrispum wychmicini]|uniref:DUF2690 domain-containing protein n=1 Tax=Actinocrispum wychmicini TaxID=1213861 RepID=UPI00104B70FB